MFRLRLRTVAPDLLDRRHANGANGANGTSPLLKLSGPSWRLRVLIQAAGWFHSHEVDKDSTKTRLFQLIVQAELISGKMIRTLQVFSQSEGNRQGIGSLLQTNMTGKTESKVPLRGFSVDSRWTWSTYLVRKRFHQVVGCQNSGICVL